MSELRQGDGHYRSGGAYGSCDRCGLTYRLRSLRKEWTGLMVCSADFDPKPAELRGLKLKPEGMPLRNARPDPGDVLGANLTTVDDL